MKFNFRSAITFLLCIASVSAFPAGTSMPAPIVPGESAAAIDPQPLPGGTIALATSSGTPRVDNSSPGVAVGGFCENVAGRPCALYRVPAGKRLVVDSVSYSLKAAADTKNSELIFGANNSLDFQSPDFFAGNDSVRLAHRFMPSSDSIALTASGSEPVHLTLQPGTILFGRWRDERSMTAEQLQRFTFQGHLIDL